MHHVLYVQSQVVLKNEGDGEGSVYIHIYISSSLRLV